MKMLFAKTVVTSFLLSLCSLTYAWQNLDQDIDIECLQSSNRLKINCDYRLIKADSNTVDIRANLDNQSLDVSGNETWPWSNAKTAILFLIDTSDPARENVVERNIVQLEKILHSLTGDQIAGLATFDKDLTILAPPGSTREEILAAAQQVRAVGKTTELYRNLINAIDALAKVQADRKTIFLFSDGLAEDQAYFHSDVVASARKNKVIINGLGYPRSVSLSVALQIIRRISEETGGRFIESDNQYKLPEGFLNDPFRNIENGGRFTIDLKNISYENVPENTGITLTFATSTGNIAVKLPIQRPAVKKPAAPESVPAPVSQPAESVQTQTVVNPAPVSVPAIRETIPVAAPGKGFEKWLLYGIPITLVVLLLLTVATLIINFIKPRERNLPQVQIGDIKPYAYLVLQDESMRRYPITRTTWRIGRSRDNELTLDDNSISRRHAEIHRSQGDEFTIIDLDSMNGVFINNEKIKIQQLKEGDIVEIGDVNFRFTLHGADYPLQETTVMQKTKAPSFTH